MSSNDQNPETRSSEDDQEFSLNVTSLTDPERADETSRLTTSVSLRSLASADQLKTADTLSSIVRKNPSFGPRRQAVSEQISEFSLRAVRLRNVKLHPEAEQRRYTAARAKYTRARLALMARPDAADAIVSPASDTEAQESVGDM